MAARLRALDRVRGCIYGIDLIVDPIVDPMPDPMLDPMVQIEL